MFISETNLEVRYYETDLMGIVHHSNYVRYFECGRHQCLLDMKLPIQEIEARGYMMPVVSVKANYKYPAKMGDVLRIVSKIDKIPLVKIVVNSEIYNQDNILVCTGEVILGFIHTDSRKPTRAPEFVVDLFSKFIK